MSFFGDLVDGVSEFFSDIKPLVDIGTDIYGMVSGTKANKQATGQFTAAELEAQRRHEQAVREAQARLAGLSTQPVRLSPTDQQSIAEARTTALRGIRGSGLSGSGRTTSAIVRDVENKVRAPLVEQERTRRERMATNLGNLDISVGEQGAATTRRIGGAQADQTLANAGLRSDTIGSVLGMIAAENKERESRRA